MSASPWEDITSTVASVVQLVSGIAMISGVYIKQSTQTARLERAKKILEECEKFLTTLKSDELSRIERHQPLFISNMRLDLQEAKTHHDKLASLVAVNPGLMREANYWGEIYTQISELLRRLEDLQQAIAATSTSYRTVSRFSGSTNSGRSYESAVMQRPYPRDSSLSTSSSSQSGSSIDSSYYGYPSSQRQPAPNPSPIRTYYSSTPDPPEISNTYTPTSSWQSHTSTPQTNYRNYSQADSNRAPYSTGADSSQSLTSSRPEPSPLRADYHSPYSVPSHAAPADEYPQYEPSQTRIDYTTRPPPRSYNSANNDDTSRGFYNNAAPNYNPQRSNDNSTSRTEESSRRPHPLFAKSSSSSNTTPTYNSHISQRYNDNSTSRTEESSRRPHPLFAKGSSSSNTTSTYNSHISQRYNDAATSRTEEFSRRPQSLFASSSSNSDTTPTYNYDPLGSRDQTSPSTTRPAGSYLEANISLRYPSSGTGTQSVSWNVDQEAEDLSLRPLYISPSGPTASTSENRRQSSFISSAPQRRPTSEYDEPTSADRNYASRSISTWVPPPSEDPHRVPRSFSSTSYTTVSSAQQVSSRPGQHTPYRSPQDNLHPTSGASRPVSYTQQSLRDDYDHDYSEEDDYSEDDDDIYDNRTPQWSSQAPSRGVSVPSVAAAKPQHSVLGGDTPGPPGPSNSSWQGEEERRQPQRSSTYFHPPPGPSSFYPPLGPSSSTPSHTSGSSSQQDRRRTDSIYAESFMPPSTSTSTYTRQYGPQHHSSGTPVSDSSSQPLRTGLNSSRSRDEDNFGRHPLSPGPTQQGASSSARTEGVFQVLVEYLQKGGDEADNSPPRDNRPIYPSPRSISRNGSRRIDVNSSQPNISSDPTVPISGIRSHSSTINRTQHSVSPYDHGRQQQSIGTFSSSPGVYHSSRSSPVNSSAVGYSSSMSPTEGYTLLPSPSTATYSLPTRTSSNNSDAPIERYRSPSSDDDFVLINP